MLIVRGVLTSIMTLMFMCVPVGTASRYQSEPSVQEHYVYICTGPESKRYHSNSNCRGLNKCSASIEKVTVAKAKSMKRTACRICYK